MDFPRIKLTTSDIFLDLGHCQYILTVAPFPHSHRTRSSFWGMFWCLKDSVIATNSSCTSLMLVLKDRALAISERSSESTYRTQNAPFTESVSTARLHRFSQAKKTDWTFVFTFKWWIEVFIVSFGSWFIIM